MRKLIKRFFELESSSGILLFVMALISFVLANTSYQAIYSQCVNASLFWINEAAMALFFLVVGLELKRNYLEGHLSTFSQIALPGIGAIGGMVVPALVYIVINIQHPALLKGWSTPVATDIAFALGVLMLFGKKIPDGLRLFLLTLAIFDDIGAIVIIALFYSHHVSIAALGLSAFVMISLYALNRYGVRAWWIYISLGVLLWICFLHAGIHPTLAGFVLAMLMPHNPRIEHILHPWVAYLIMPIFALANAGITLQNMTYSTVVLGVALGLFIGKQFGVFVFSWAMIKSGFAKLPHKSSWLGFYGVSILCGIGFTMSLFLGTLSFKYDDVAIIDQVRLGVIIGSLLSGLLGVLVLVIAKEKAK